MTELDLAIPNSPFDEIRNVDENGNEYWSARDMMPLMAYQTWHNFESAISRAIHAAKNTDTYTEQAFYRVREEATGGRSRLDYRLSRYGAYLVAMNGDPNKSEVAAAQAYFAIKAREAEVAAPQPMSGVEVARRWYESELAREAAENKIAVLEPKADIADQFIYDENDLVYLLDIAKNAKMTQIQLTRILRDHGVLFKDKLHYRVGYETWFEVKWDYVPHLKSHQPALKVTREGVKEIFELLKAQGQLFREGGSDQVIPQQRSITRPKDNRP